MSCERLGAFLGVEFKEELPRLVGQFRIVPVYQKLCHIEHYTIFEVAGDKRRLISNRVQIAGGWLTF